MTNIRQPLSRATMPLSEDTKVLVRSRKKVLQTKIVSLHTLDLVQQHSLERTSSVRLHKVQSSVSVIRLLHLVVQMRRLSLQLLIILFSSVSLEMVQRVEIYYQLQERLYLDLLVLYLVSLLLLVVETNPIQFCSILLVRQQTLYLSRTTRIQIYSISLEGCNREFLFTLLLGLCNWRVCNRGIRLGSYHCHSNSTIGRLGTNQYKRRDNTQGCRELGIPSRRVQLRSSWRSTLSKQRYILYWRIQSYCSDYWNNRCCNVPTFRRSRYRSCDSIRVFWYYWYCYLQGWHQHLRCKLVQSGSSTHSLR